MRAYERDLRALAAEHGCVVEDHRRHYRLTHPDGWFVSASKTPSDPHTLKHVRASLRRAERGLGRYA